jgi:small subunit ribosomal protein S17
MYTRRKSRVGVVTSDKMQKTVVVAVESHKRHPLYNKTIRRTTRYKVHDANDLAKVGDIVRIVENRPLSREKRWRLAEIVTRRDVAEIAPREIDASMLGINRPHTESAAATAGAPAVEAPTADEVEMSVEEQAPPPAEAEAEPEAETPLAEAEAVPAESEAEPEAEAPVAEAEAVPAEAEAEAVPAEAEAEPVAEAPIAEAEAVPAESEAGPEAIAEQEKEQTEK